MKLQIKYNHPDFEKLLKIAQQTAPIADIISLGSLPLYQKGIAAVETFKTAFPEKELYVDAKITDKGGDTIKLFAQAGASYVSILAGTHFSIVKKAVEAAERYNIKVILDFLNTDIFGQFAVEAEILGVHGTLLHRRINGGQADLEQDWQVIRENSELPIFIEGKISEDSISQIINLKPAVIVIGSAITNDANPAQKATTLKEFINQ